MQTHFTISDHAQEDAFLAAISPSVIALARRYYYRVNSYVSLELDDLEQEAMIAAWQAANRVADPANFRQSRAYCLTWARGAILDQIEKAVGKHAYSLDALTEPRTADSPPREFAAPEPLKPTSTNYVMRRALLRELRKVLSPGQLAVLLSVYRIDEGKDGKAMDKEAIMKRLGIDAKTFESYRYRGLRKLRERFSFVV